jgi:hypothetical protein
VEVDRSIQKKKPLKRQEGQERFDKKRGGTKGGSLKVSKSGTERRGYKSMKGNRCFIISNMG